MLCKYPDNLILIMRARIIALRWCGALSSAVMALARTGWWTTRIGRRRCRRRSSRIGWWRSRICRWSSRIGWRSTRIGWRSASNCWRSSRSTEWIGCVSESQEAGHLNGRWWCTTACTASTFGLFIKIIEYIPVLLDRWLYNVHSKTDCFSCLNRHKTTTKSKEVCTYNHDQISIKTPNPKCRLYLCV